MGRVLVDDHQLACPLAEQIQGKKLADETEPGKART